MGESPPDDHEYPPPDDSGLPLVMTFDKESTGLRGWLRRRSPISLVLLLVMLGAATLWVLGFFSGDGPEARADRDTVTAPPAGAATTSATAGTGRPEPEVAPSEVEATVATTVELEVRPRNDAGYVLPDTLLRFVVESGAATLEADTARTDASGTARVAVALAPRPDTTVVAARVVGAELPPVRTTVIGRPGPPERIVKVDGDGQVTDAAGLIEGLVIRVTDGAGNPLPDVPVFFRPGVENGLVAPSRTSTDSLGRASAMWRLGEAVGVQRLNAEVEGGAIPPVTFTATALGDTAEAEVVEPAALDTAQTETPEVQPDPVEPEPVAPDPVEVVRRPFAIGGTFVCSLASGRAACRGGNDRGQLGGGGGGDFEGLAAGVSHACALDDAGAAWCWGANDGGQLGDGSRADRPEPVPVATELAFSILTAGAGHTCGLASNGRVACWGRNVSGQLGDGTTEDRPTPALLPDRGRAFRNLVAGWEHTCGLSAGGELACWGSNGQGQLGDGSRIARPTPTTVPGSFGSMVAGSRHTCGISGDRALCWGDNSFGQLGDGSTQARTTPTAVAGLPAPPVRLAAGAVHTCALLDDGSAWCWGQNVHGQIGDGTTQNRAAPSRVAGGLTFTSLYAGGALTCGFTPDGSQYCWGLNQSGQVGDGTRDNRASPTRVGG